MASRYPMQLIAETIRRKPSTCKLLIGEGGYLFRYQIPRTIVSFPN